MRVYEKNGRWYLEGMIRGKRYHKAIPEAVSQRDAEKYLTIFKADLLRGRLDLAEDTGNKPFVQAVDLYIKYAQTNLKNSYSAVKMIERFKEQWKTKLISDITPKLIDEYKRMRLNTVISVKKIAGDEVKKYIKASTVNREIGVLSSMFTQAIKNGLAKSNPVNDVKKLRVKNKLERHLSPDEEERILKVCDGDYSFLNFPSSEIEKMKKKYKDYHNYLKPLFLMALNTAMRKSELLNMTWDCVNFRDKTITALDTKNNISNTIPMSNKLEQVLKEIREKEPDTKYIFTNPDTGTKYKCFTKSFGTVCKIAGVNNFTFHDFRHTAATRLVDIGTPLPVVQKILNHKKIQTTMRYAHTMEEQKQAAIESLSKYGLPN